MKRYNIGFNVNDFDTILLESEGCYIEYIDYSIERQEWLIKNSLLAEQVMIRDELIQEQKNKLENLEKRIKERTFVINHLLSK